MNFTHNFERNFFSSAIIEWNRPDPIIRNSPSYESSKENILKFKRALQNSSFQCHSTVAIKYFTRLQLNFRLLRDHKFKNPFQTFLFHSNPAVCKQKGPLVLYSNASNTKTSVLFFLPTFVISNAVFWIETSLILSRQFFKEITMLVKHRTLIFQMLLSNTYCLLYVLRRIIRKTNSP